MPAKKKFTWDPSTKTVTYDGDEDDWRTALENSLDACKSINEIRLLVHLDVSLLALSKFVGCSNSKKLDYALARCVEDQNTRRHRLELPPLTGSLDDVFDAETTLNQLYMISPLPNGKHPVTHLQEHIANINGSWGFGDDKKWVNYIIGIATKYYEISSKRTYVPLPRNHTKLQLWANSLRQKGKDHRLLKRWQVALLNLIGFVWDNEKALFEANCERLKQHKAIFGHCAVSVNYGDTKLVSFTRHLRGNDRSGFSNQSEERRRILREIGFDPKVSYRDQVYFDETYAEDKAMTTTLELYFEENGHTNVQFPSRSTNTTQIMLYYWLRKAKTRLLLFHYDDYKKPNSDEKAPVTAKEKEMEKDLAEMQAIVIKEEGYVSFEKTVLARLNKLNIVLKDYPHFSVNRIENRHFLELLEVYKKIYEEELIYTSRDKPIGKDPEYPDGKRRHPGHYRRPDMTIIDNFLALAIIDELDEIGHVDRRVESEQRKLYYLILLLIGREIMDINIVRLTPVHPNIPNAKQVQAHAKILHDISTDDRSELDKPRVRVILLDFSDENHHIDEYQKRLIPPGSGIERAKKEDEWDKKVMFDEVIRVTTDEVLAHGTKSLFG